MGYKDMGSTEQRNDQRDNLDIERINTIKVQFSPAGRLYEFYYERLDLRTGDKVVVDTERGQSVAQVVSLGFGTKRPDIVRIVRKAHEKDLRKSEHITSESVETKAREEVKKAGLEMRIISSELLFGGAKAIIYFTAPGRVDFRELVKTLARDLQTRVELKQVGPRDETKLLGGVGICGREYCCSSFLREFVPVSIKMAKNQNLALNPTKISGGCGRLLCCLSYEDDIYTQLKQKLPARGVQVEVLFEGSPQVGTVEATDLFNQTVEVCLDREGVHAFPVGSIKVLKTRKAPAKKEEDWLSDVDLKSLEE